jgi:hypothetical protein
MKAHWTSRLDDIAKNQLPFAIANALNDTAKAAAAEAREEAGKRLNIRKKSLLSIFIRTPADQRATKKKLSARVMVAGPKSDPTRGPVLAAHEVDGIKTPNKGRYVAMPGREIMSKGARGGVKRGFELAKFKPFLRAGPKKSYGKMGTFLVTSKKSGIPMLLQPIGKRLRVLWLFVKQTRMTANLGFDKAVRRAIKRDMTRNVGTRLTQAIASAKQVTKGGGVTSSRL